MIRLRIKELAQQKNISQSRLQINAQITLPMLRRYWKNETESVHLQSLDRIAKALGVRVRDLFVDEYDEPVVPDPGQEEKPI